MILLHSTVDIEHYSRASQSGVIDLSNRSDPHSAVLGSSSISVWRKSAFYRQVLLLSNHPDVSPGISMAGLTETLHLSALEQVSSASVELRNHVRPSLCSVLMPIDQRVMVQATTGTQRPQLSLRNSGLTSPNSLEVDSLKRSCSKRTAGVTAGAFSVDTTDTTSTSNHVKEDIISAESRLLVQSYARSPVVFVRGEGCKLYDTEDNEYLDMTSGIAVNALGHGHPGWVKAVSEQAAKLAHVSNLFHTVPQVKLAERLVESSFADRVFMVNSGTEAIEAAMKFARKYHHELAKKVHQNATPAKEFISFSSGFHGRTLGSLSLTSNLPNSAPFEPLVPGAKVVTFGDLEATTNAVTAGRTAAIFVEPLQGEGGVHPATASFLQGLRDICDETGALLVFDEVQCGLGRTGTLWAHEAYDVKPDLMAIAKPLAGGLPIGAVLVTESVASSISAGDHGSTFAGGPLVCHAALAVLDHIQAPGFLDSVAEKGAYLKSQLQERLSKHPRVKEVRGEGLLVGIQLDVNVNPLLMSTLKAGLLIHTAGKSGKGDVARLIPPLIITKEEIDQAIYILENCMSSLM